MRKKVAIVRGPSLSKWEMQIYEPLTKNFDLLGIGAKPKINDIQEIKFPCVFLPLRFRFVQKFPEYTFLMNTVLGDTRWLAGFEKTVAGYDLLHSVELRTGFTLQAVRAKQKGLVRAVTVTVYENIPFVGDEYQSRLRLKQRVLPYIDHFFAANEEARLALLTEGVETSKIAIVPQSVDTAIFTPRLKKNSNHTLKKKLLLQKEDFVVLSVARMVWEKGWYDLIRAAYKINQAGDQNRKIVFVCIGDGPERKKLIKMVKQLHLENVVLFPGNIEYQHMQDFFRMADIFVLPSIPTRIWNEQFGGVLIEAMASGLPIVGTMSGGIHSTVGEEGGIFVPPQDFAKLAEGVMSLFNNPHRMQKIGQRNREVSVRLYDVHKVAFKINNIWNSLI